MARRKQPEAQPDWVDSNRPLVMFTSIVIIILSFFILLVTRANYDETKHGQVVESLRQTFGIMPGGRSAIGVEEGLPVDSTGPTAEDGELVVQNSEMARVRALLAPAIMDREARIIHTQGQKIISLSAGLLFPPDSAVINAQMAEVLITFCRIMADSEAPIAIEGHTDNLPPQTRGVGDNWDISGARALAVLDFFVEQGQLEPGRLVAYGYAGTKPFYPNSTPDGRARNNRVDLVLDFERLKADELKAIAQKAASYNFKGFDFLLKDGPIPEGGQP